MLSGHGVRRQSRSFVFAWGGREPPIEMAKASASESAGFPVCGGRGGVKNGRFWLKLAIFVDFADLQTASAKAQTGFTSLPTAFTGLSAATKSLPTGFPSRKPAFVGLPTAFAGPPSGGASGSSRPVWCQPFRVFGGRRHPKGWRPNTRHGWKLAENGAFPVGAGC
jgi:hypothetical protein